MLSISKSLKFFLSILLPLIAFLLFGFYLFFVGKNNYGPGEGLLETMEKEYIVQYLGKVVPPLSLEVYPEIRASKLRLGKETKAIFHVRNVGKVPVEFYLTMETSPNEISKLESSFDFKKKLSLGKEEKMKISFPYLLKKSLEHSKDGTIEMYFIFSSVFTENSP